MLPADSVALCLRFREPDVSDEPPDVLAFERRGRSPMQAPPEDAGSDRTDRSEEIGVLGRGGPLGPSAPVMVFLRRSGYAIPAPVLGHAHDPGDDGLPELGSWSVSPTVFGWLASVPGPRSERQRSRVAWIIAACLPLVLPVEAAAAPRPQRPPIQVPDPSDGDPTTTSPTTTTTTTSPTSEPGTDTEAEPELGTAAGPTEGSGEETSDPLVPLPEPAPALDGGAEVDQATIDAAWEGVDGFDVDLRLKGGGKMRGRVGAVQRDTFTLIQATTGAVLVLPKSGVSSLRVATPPALPPRNGVAALVGGSLLTAVGTPVFISGLTFLGICPSCTYLHLPMLLIGGAALGGGIPLLVRGTRQRRAYQEALQERALSPVVLRTSHGGWTGGLRFRF